jgi:hypothetical protein
MEHVTLRDSAAAETSCVPVVSNLQDVPLDIAIMPREEPLDVVAGDRLAPIKPVVHADRPEPP